MEPTINSECRRLRRAAPMSQSELAGRIGTVQSQISQFERGDSKSLSREKIEKLCEVLGLDEGLRVEHHVSGAAICSNSNCPGNLPVFIGDSVRMKPKLSVESRSTFCNLCGEILDKVCHGCGGAIAPGLNCPDCGTDYVPVPDAARSAADLKRWVKEEQVNRQFASGITNSPDGVPLRVQ